LPTARKAVLACALLASATIAIALARPKPVPTARPAPVATASAARLAPPDAGEDEDEEPAYAFRVPTGKPAELSCGEARRVIAQVRTGLAYEPDSVSPHALAAGAADWLDPHGLWSAAPDSPIQARIEKRADELVAEMEGRVGDDCPAAREVGDALMTWVDLLRTRFDQARAGGREADAAAASEEIPFDAIAY